MPQTATENAQETAPPASAPTAGSHALAKSYTPAEHEDRIRRQWLESGAFAGHTRDEGDDRRPYCILIPPPNVTAALHLGHAFNNTLQDVLIRLARMRGFNTLWMPGTDHAGIATQTVVDKRLQSQGEPALKHYKLLEDRGEKGREAFIGRVQQWKDEYEATITEQLQSMGCSCDWDRQRFTMDPICAKAVREAFFQLFKEGLIDRGKRLVNWDPVTLTALADDEVEMKEVDGHFWYLRYPLVHQSNNASDPADCQEVTWSELAARGYPGAEKHPDDDVAWVTVATTRPETYLGDTAVAVNPSDPRAAALEGLFAQLPLVGRVIPIIQDDYVVLADAGSSDPKAQYATGFLKVTPAHDPNDWEIGQRHDLAAINVMAPDASISDQHGWEDIGDAHLLVGMSREDARTKVVDEFKARGLLEATKPYSHSVGHSYRSHVPVEPYLSDQWYVKVSDDRLVGEAQRALSDKQFEGEKPSRETASDARSGDGELEFFPPRYAKMYQSWHDNLRDWCISRQLWWGHRIPVWNVTFAGGPSPSAEELRNALQTYLKVNKAEPEVSVNCVTPGERNTIAAFVCARSDKADMLLRKLAVYVREWWDKDSTWNEGEPRPELLDEPAEIAALRNHDIDLHYQVMRIFAIEQDPDVLDTWFSSGLWPLNTMGWPTPDDHAETRGLLETFNPTTVLCTGRDIITLWVSRMVMFNRFFNDGKVPFRHVYINPMIQDGNGQRMSKSLGNGVDPRDIIHTHGADALRFSLVQMATTTQDCRMPVDMICPHCETSFEPKQITSPAGYVVAAPQQKCPSCKGSMTSGYGAASGAATPSDDTPLARNTSRKFDRGRNFANKLWNATRFALSKLDGLASAAPGPAINTDDMALADRWILARLHATQRAIDEASATYQFSVYANLMDEFIWNDLCDWYLEAIKPTVADSVQQQHVLATVINAALRLLHPICPFVTEALWPAVRAASANARVAGVELADSEQLATATWPTINDSIADEEAVTTFERAQSLTQIIRTLRAEHQVKPRKQITLHANSGAQRLMSQADGMIEALAGIAEVTTTEKAPATAMAFSFEGDQLAVSGLVDAVDADAERARLAGDIADLEKRVDSFAKKLGNEKYINNAPDHVVEQTRAMHAQAAQDLETKRSALNAIAGDP